ncbi:uncharacterized protein LOC110683258 [Chenopodium quinoa]|uniref:uncharacterized protein LOC110683258 n=1 Tax=Chenopodium quinoa TaxID=63459 RepID=UPI000B7978EC|nr:uncharacterized protein LOC110683258 [Chenopodium quinoa]
MQQQPRSCTDSCNSHQAATTATRKLQQPPGSCTGSCSSHQAAAKETAAAAQAAPKAAAAAIQETESLMQFCQGNGDGYEGDDDANIDEAQPQNRVNKELTVEQKRNLVDEIMLHMEGDSLPRGFLANLARKHSVYKSTTTRYFKFIKQSLAQGIPVVVENKKLGRTEPKPKVYTDEFLTSVPLYKRGTERGYAAALKIPKTALHRLRQQGRLRTHTNTIHPALTEKHKISRLKWVLSHIDPIPAQGDPNFRDMQQWIHLDEKWFYINPEARTFYLLPTEDDPYRAQQSRRFKIKAMFMGMIGKPLFDDHTNMVRDGKYGLFPFVKDMLLTHVIPTIYEKWPEQLPKDIIIQWDNARPHQVPRDEEFHAACNAYGFNIEFIFQPAQSLETNVLDLGLFSVIQSLQYQSFPRNLDELIQEVARAFEELDPVLNKYTWITLQSCLIKILEKQGGNNISPPHMKKRSLDSQGLLPQSLQVDRNLIGEVVQFLDSITDIVDDHGHMKVDAD